MTLAAFIALFSCFAFLFKWMRNRCCTVIFGTLLLPFWIIALAVGLSAMGVAHTSADEFLKECDKLKSQQSAIAELDYTKLEKNFNLFHEVQINENMCSRNCPCNDAATKDQWTSLTAEQLKTDYKRI